MASGDTLLMWDCREAEFPGSSYPTLDVRNNHPVLDYALNEEAYFSAVMPRNYDSGGVTVYFHYAMSSAVADDVKIESRFERIGDQQQDIDSDGFATAQDTGDVTVPGTSGNVDIINATHTDGAQMDSVAVGEMFRLGVKRVAVAGTDATGDLELLKIEVKET